MSRWRPYLLGLLGLAVITFPFLWLHLKSDPVNRTIRVTWAPENGLGFLSDLLPVFLVGFLIWLFVRAERYWRWSDTLARHPTWQAAAKRCEHSWAWVAMPLVLCGPFFLSSGNVGLLTEAGIYMLLAIGLNITVGMTGLLVLGYAGFFAFGAYVFALGQQNLPYFPWWLAAVAAFPLGGAAGYLLGLPCLRLRGDYLAIVTLGFAEAFRETLKNLSYDGTMPHNLFSQQIRQLLDGVCGPNWHSFAVIQQLKNVYLWLMQRFDTHGDKGISIQDYAIFHGVNRTFNSEVVAYIVVALVLFLAVFLVQRLYHSPVGRAWIAIRENEVAAAAVGVPVVQMKLLAFSLSAAVAAVAGVLSGAINTLVTPELCNFSESIKVLAMVILGGLGSTYGVLLGGALLYLLPEFLDRVAMLKDNPFIAAHAPTFLRDALGNLGNYHLLIFGGIMVIMMLYRPQGLAGSRRRKEEILNQ